MGIPASANSGLGFHGECADPHLLAMCVLANLAKRPRPLKRSEVDITVVPATMDLFLFINKTDVSLTQPHKGHLLRLFPESLHSLPP